jgi:hypothetical protein
MIYLKTTKGSFWRDVNSLFPPIILCCVNAFSSTGVDYHI